MPDKLSLGKRQCTYNIIVRGICKPLLGVEKQRLLYILSVSVALVIQHAKCMQHILLSSVACPALPYFSTLSH
jgi:hypothetical protein